MALEAFFVRCITCGTDVLCKWPDDNNVADSFLCASCIARAAEPSN